MKNILALTRYGSIGPSSRYRFYQYIPYLEKNGFKILVTPFFNDLYTKSILSNNENKLKKNLLVSYFKRIRKLCILQNIDALWIEKELLPWTPSFIENLFLNIKVPIITDYDDAVFHRYDKHSNFLTRYLLSNKIKRVMNKSTLVIAGNKYIANYAKLSGVKKVEIIPTSIEIQNKNIKRKTQTKSFTIGWIGSASTSKHINEISDVLIKICLENKVIFKAIGANKNFLNNFPVKIVSWKEKNEIEEISNFDVGIMPLPDSPWERGKCGLKLIQYMSCGIPVIASPVGINKEIVEHGKNGFLAKNIDEWLMFLRKLKNEPNLRSKMGQEGLKKVNEKYSITTHSKSLVKIFNSLLNK